MKEDSSTQLLESPLSRTNTLSPNSHKSPLEFRFEAWMMQAGLSDLAILKTVVPHEGEGKILTLKSESK